MNSPIRKIVAVTHHVEAHLFDAFQENASEFFVRARGGTTAQQRAAEIRAQDHDRALDSLVALVKLAHGDTGQCRTVAYFLASLYNGADFPFDQSELRSLDEDIFEHCVAVLRLNYVAAMEVHRYFPDGEDLFRDILMDWGLVKRPSAPPTPGDFFSATLVTVSNAPGYRDATLHITLGAAENGALPTELGLSAKDTEKLLGELLQIHRFAWSERNGRDQPIDAKAGEQRPSWLPG